MRDAEQERKEWEEMRADPSMSKFVNAIEKMNASEKFATGMMVSLMLASETKISHDMRSEIFAKVCHIVEQAAKIETVSMLLKHKVAIPPDMAFFSLKLLDESKRDREQLVNLLQVATQAGWKDKAFTDAKPAAA